MEKKLRWGLFILVDLIAFIIIGFLVYNFYFKDTSKKTDDSVFNDLLDSIPLSANNTENADQISKLVKEKLKTEKQDWFGWWNKITPYLTFDKFTLREVNEMTMNERFPYPASVEDDTVRREKSVYAKSPNGLLWADALAGMELVKGGGKVKALLDVDSSVSIAYLDSNTYEQVLTCGTPCGFDDVVWIDNNKLLILGYQIAYNATDKPELDSNYLPTLWVIDLNEPRALYEYVGPSVPKMDYLNNKRSSYLVKRYGGIEFGF